MRAAVLLAAMLSGGCLASSLTTLGLDAYQTRGNAERGWNRGWHEDNPVLGQHPGAPEVDAYFAGIAVATVLVDQLLPGRWYRLAFHAVLTAVELRATWNNYECETGRGCP